MRLWYKTGSVAFLRELPLDEIVCLDVETTGLDPCVDEVLQVAVIRGDDEVLMSRLVRPVRRASWQSAQRVHGISPEAVGDCQPLSSHAGELAAALCSAHLIVGYNVTFDLAFIRAAGISVGHARLFDVMREFAPVAGRWDPRRQDFVWVPLERCARHYGISFRAHDALDDAQATLRCFLAMLGREAGAPSPPAAVSYLDVVARFSCAERSGRGSPHGRKA